MKLSEAPESIKAETEEEGKVVHVNGTRKELWDTADERRERGEGIVGVSERRPRAQR